MPDAEPDLDLANQAQILWEFLIPGTFSLPVLAERAFEAARILEVDLPWDSCTDPWGPGCPKDGARELKRLQLQRRGGDRYANGILEPGNQVARFLIELAARDTSPTKFVHRIVMFIHLLSRGDLLLNADGSELAGLLGRPRRGLLVPLRSQCEELLGVRGMGGLSDRVRAEIAERRIGNTSRAGGRWHEASVTGWNS